MNEELSSLEQQTDLPSYEGEHHLQTTRNWLLIPGILMIALGVFFMASTLYALTGYFEFSYQWLIILVIEMVPVAIGGLLIWKSRLISGYLQHSELGILEAFFSANRIYWLVMCVIIGLSILVNIITLTKMVSNGSGRFNYFQF